MPYTDFAKDGYYIDLPTSGDITLLSKFRVNENIELSDITLCFYISHAALPFNARLHILSSNHSQKSIYISPWYEFNTSTLYPSPPINKDWLGEICFSFSRNSVYGISSYNLGIETSGYTYSASSIASVLIDWPERVYSSFSDPRLFGAKIRVIGYK